jgi:eukaryotic-like serine/threonine-protein kinase
LKNWAGAVRESFTKHKKGRTVALKVIRATQTRKAKEQFEREIGVSQHLRHPNIAGLENVETLGDGRLLIVMPFLEGKTVDKLLVPVSFHEALNIITQTAAGLAHAHAKGVIHCDIKPANLMLTKGQIKILDFGLARLETEDESGEKVGTLEYMAPEAARGQKLNPSSDLWSLGVVFYELLTGHSPFQGTSTVATLRNIAELELASVGSGNFCCAMSLMALFKVCKGRRKKLERAKATMVESKTWMTSSVRSRRKLAFRMSS